MTGYINLFVKVGTRTELVRFNVVDRLGTEFILGCDYLENHIEAIRPRRRVLEITDGHTVPILRRALRSLANRDTITDEE